MEELIKDYQENIKSIKELATKYHMGQKKVREILVENNVYIRTAAETSILKRNPGHTLEEIETIVVENYNKGWGLLKSGKDFGLSMPYVRKILDKHNIEKRDFHTSIQVANQIYDRTTTQYKKNKDFFNVQSSDMAWLLGFLASDGNVSKKENLIRIELSSVDEEILQKIKQVVSIENPIRIYTNKKGFEFAALAWSCKEHKEELSKYGIVPNKTYILTPPEKLDKKYYIDYIRGYFDGDGTINLNKCAHGNALRWGICSATKEMLEWIVDVLYEQYNIPKVNVLRDTSHPNPFYTIVYSTNSTKKIREVLYTENSLFLKRKKDKFDNLINTYSIKE